MEPRSTEGNAFLKQMISNQQEHNQEVRGVKNTLPPINARRHSLGSVQEVASCKGGGSSPGRRRGVSLNDALDVMESPGDFDAGGGQRSTKKRRRMHQREDGLCSRGPTCARSHSGVYNWQSQQLEGGRQQSGGQDEKIMDTGNDTPIVRRIDPQEQEFSNPEIVDLLDDDDEEGKKGEEEEAEAKWYSETELDTNPGPSNAGCSNGPEQPVSRRSSMPSRIQEHQNKVRTRSLSPDLLQDAARNEYEDDGLDSSYCDVMSAEGCAEEKVASLSGGLKIDRSPMMGRGGQRYNLRPSPSPIEKKRTESHRYKHRTSPSPNERYLAESESEAPGIGHFLSRLTSGQLKLIEELQVEYPKGVPGAVLLRFCDLKRLEPSEFLNDNIIEFYMKFIVEDMGRDELVRQKIRGCHFFNSYLFEKVNRDNDQTDKCPGYASVKTWTKNVDLFKKDYLFFPIHETVHWSLVIVCHPGAGFMELSEEERQIKSPCLLHLDSMGGEGHNTDFVCARIRKYLECEWDEKKGSYNGPSVSPQESFRVKRLDVPLQGASVDCGLFVLTYFEYFLHAAPQAIHIDTVESLKENHSFKYFLSKEWFPKKEAYHLRVHLRKLLVTQMFSQYADQEVQRLASKIMDMCESHQYVGPREMEIRNSKIFWTRHKKAEKAKKRKKRCSKEDAGQDAISRFFELRENSTVHRGVRGERDGEGIVTRSVETPERNLEDPQTDMMDVDIGDQVGRCEANVQGCARGGCGEEVEGKAQEDCVGHAGSVEGQERIVEQPGVQGSKEGNDEATPNGRLEAMRQRARNVIDLVLDEDSEIVLEEKEELYQRHGQYDEPSDEI